jgi:hypothetical protein
VLRGYPTVRWRAWLEISPEVKTRPVLNCRLENVVVDKSPLHQPPFNRRGHACSLLTRTTSGRFWANGRPAGSNGEELRPGEWRKIAPHEFSRREYHRSVVIVVRPRDLEEIASRIVICEAIEYSGNLEGYSCSHQTRQLPSSRHQTTFGPLRETPGCPRHRCAVCTSMRDWRRPRLPSLTPKVKSPSPPHRFLIALHSPDGVFETGLLWCPPEKNAAKLTCSIQRCTFSGPV